MFKKLSSGIRGIQQLNTVRCCFRSGLRLYFDYLKLNLFIISGHVTRNRPSSKMTKYVECWGADRPFANIAESKLVKNIGLAVSVWREEAVSLRSS